MLIVVALGIVKRAARITTAMNFDPVCIDPCISITELFLSSLV